MTMTRIEKKIRSDTVAEAAMCLLLMYYVSLFVHMPSILAALRIHPHSPSQPTSISKRGGDFKAGNGRDREIERRGNGPKWSCQSASQNAAGRQFPVASDAGSILPPSSPSSISLFTPSPERKSKRLNRLLNPLPRSGLLPHAVTLLRASNYPHLSLSSIATAFYSDFELFFRIARRQK